MTFTDRDRYIIENHLYQLAHEAAEQARASLRIAREKMREAAIEYAVRTNLEQDTAVELARDLIEHVEWGVCCHFIEYKPAAYAASEPGE